MLTRMRIVLFITFLLLYLRIELSAQQFDSPWLIGYMGGSNSFGVSRVSFGSGNFKIQKDTIFEMSFFDNNAVISDGNEKVVAAFNGYRIHDRSGKVMLNGDSVWYETLPYLYGYSDDDLPQGGMFLPWPGHPDSLLLFYTSQGNILWPVSVELASLNLFYALIQPSANNGLGAVVERRVSVIDDTIQYGRLTATRHANGRDWWILVNERNSNTFYRVLLNPSGIHRLDSQPIGLPVIDGLGQAVFSPDGQKYMIKNSISGTIGNYLDVYDFNRCTGYLDNHRQIHYSGSAVGGVAVSSNSRYLYVSFRTTLYQYDLTVDDLETSKVLIGEYIPASTGLPQTFYTMQLAPDNKIYMCATNGVQILHVIHSPDEAGLNCNFQQAGIQLPTYNAASVTYSPNFRLGPIDGSTCDSLNINNQPKAWYGYDQDTTDLLFLKFRDLSYYEPATWSWDFGDGSTGSNERHPVHTFDSAGVYQVCLTVSNIYGTDTHCKTLYLGVSAQNNPSLQNQILVSPNPFSQGFRVVLHAQLTNPVFKLYNQLGLLLLDRQMPINITEFETVALPQGIYFWELSTGNEKVAVGKIIKN